MSDKLNIKKLLERLGYSFEESQPSCYHFALALAKLGFDDIRITQAVSLNYPIKINL